MTRQECEKKAADEREAIETALRAKELELIQVKGARDLLSQRVGLVEAELDEALGGKGEGHRAGRGRQIRSGRIAEDHGGYFGRG